MAGIIRSNGNTAGGLPALKAYYMAVRAVRDARDALRDALLALEQFKTPETNGVDPANWALLATAGQFQQDNHVSANAAAKALYDEGASLLFKLSIAGEEPTEPELNRGLIGNVGPAITQSCAKLGF